MHDCPRSEESGSLCSYSNTVFLRSLRAFRLRSACHIQFLLSSTLQYMFSGRWSTLLGRERFAESLANMHTADRGGLLKNSQLRWAPLQKKACAPAFSPARGGISQTRYTGATMKPLPLYTVVTRVATYVHFGCDVIWFMTGLSTKLLGAVIPNSNYCLIQGPYPGPPMTMKCPYEVT